MITLSEVRCELTVLNCDDCGACCQHMVMPPFVPNFNGDFPNEEWSALERDHPDLADGLKAEYKRKADQNHWPDEAPCFWFDRETKRCKHHEARPQICRDFEVGSPECLAYRRERKGEP